jgi:hypothetical protein
MFFDIIKSLYLKTELKVIPESNLSIALNKWLSLDKDNILTLKRILPYFYYITPEHYYDLLFYSIPQKTKIPFLKKIEKVEEPKENVLFSKIKYVLDWSERELQFNKNILIKLIEPNRTYWEKELGVKECKK